MSAITLRSVEVRGPTAASPAITLRADGTVPTGGYTDARIEPRIYVMPPTDGIQEFDFTVTPPPAGAMVTEVVTLVSATYDFAKPPAWVKGVRLSVADTR